MSKFSRGGVGRGTLTTPLQEELKFVDLHSRMEESVKCVRVCNGKPCLNITGGRGWGALSTIAGGLLICTADWRSLERMYACLNATKGGEGGGGSTYRIVDLHSRLEEFLDSVCRVKMQQWLGWDGGNNCA